MGFICCVPGCSNTSRKGFQMHMIPKDAELYNLWLTNIGRLDLKEKGSPSRVRKSYRVCNMHFGSEAMYIGSRNKSCIRKDAVPTLFLKNDISCHSYFSDDRNQPINKHKLNNDFLVERMAILNLLISVDSKTYNLKIYLHKILKTVNSYYKRTKNDDINLNTYYMKNMKIFSFLTFLRDLILPYT
ncbi:hypothetical protein ABEB36_013905 [Hypothenemus hampei]|uniref:THAP-type domain-containing protein n=1 Tax=Hypothenemus hampei TaxID=57062 RepID=A0ABD1E5Z8_HYPHA